MEKNKSNTQLFSFLVFTSDLARENCFGQLMVFFISAQALNFHFSHSLPSTFFVFVNNKDAPSPLASFSYPDLCSNLIFLFDLPYQPEKTFRFKSLLSKSKRIHQFLSEEIVFCSQGIKVKTVRMLVDP